MLIDKGVRGMTAWIERKAQQRSILYAQVARIKGQTAGVFQELCEAIRAVVEEYRQTFPPHNEPYDNINKVVGSGKFSVIVLHGPNPVRGQESERKRRITIELDTSACQIREDYGRQVLDIRIHRNGEVGLFRGETELTLEEAAEIIMAPFLFPDLEQPAKAASA